MFVREKRIGSYRYLYLVETVRENGQTKQRIIRNLGRKEVVEAGGDLDRLARSAARLSQRSMILSLIEDGSIPDLTCRRIGAPLLLERLWQESGSNRRDRKSTRLNSSHGYISYAVFCLKKKKTDPLSNNSYASAAALSFLTL